MGWHLIELSKSFLLGQFRFLISPYFIEVFKWKTFCVFKWFGNSLNKIKLKNYSGFMFVCVPFLVRVIFVSFAVNLTEWLHHPSSPFHFQQLQFYAYFVWFAEAESSSATTARNSWNAFDWTNDSFKKKIRRKNGKNCWDWLINMRFILSVAFNEFVFKSPDNDFVSENVVNRRKFIVAFTVNLCNNNDSALQPYQFQLPQTAIESQEQRARY